MATNPWQTSDDLINTIKRKISIPISQNLFSETDILAFLNEEMFISQVPSILEFHEDYLLYEIDIPLEANKSSYPIPDRAIGMKLRDVYYKDVNGYLGEMTRVLPENESAYSGTVNSSSFGRFIIKGDNIVIVPQVGASVSGSISVQFFIRPNQLVRNSRAAYISSFSKKITVDNTILVSGDKFYINNVVFTAGTDFAIGGTSTITATNLAAAISSNGVASATASSADVSVVFSNISIDSTFTTSNTSAFIIDSGLTLNSSSTIPSNITNSSLVDILKTKPGHKILNYDILLPSNAVSTSSIYFNDSSALSKEIQVGDYICCANECIIPQIPPDFHNLLAERACAKILESIGDKEGAAIVMNRVAMMEKNQANLIDDRVDGAPKIIVNRHSVLRNRRSFWRY